MSTAQMVVPVYVATPALYPIIDRFFHSVKAAYPELEIIAVDDCSPHPLLDSWPIKFVHRKNYGYTATVNTGLALTESPIIIVANDDLIIKPGDLDPFFALEGNTIASPRDTASDGTDAFGSLWGMTRAVYHLLGDLNDQYIHFYSDKDYYERAKEKGVKIVKWDYLVDHMESCTYNEINKTQLLEKDGQTWEKYHK